MKKVKVLAAAFAIGSATLFAHNPINKQIPPNNINEVSEDENIEKNGFHVNRTLLKAISNNDQYAIVSLKEHKRILEENKLEAIKNYTQFMPDIVGKE